MVADRIARTPGQSHNLRRGSGVQHAVTDTITVGRLTVDDDEI